MVVREKTNEIEPPSMQLGSVNPGGIPRKYRVYNLKGPHLIQGGTLERLFWLDKEPTRPGVYRFVVYKPTENQLKDCPCDACPTRHRPKNLDCSRTRGTLTTMTLTNVLYSSKTLKPVSTRFTVLNTKVEPGAKTFIATLKLLSWKL